MGKKNKVIEPPETPYVTDLEGNVLTGEQLEPQPLNLTDEERAALPALEPLGDGPVELVEGISDAPKEYKKWSPDGATLRNEIDKRSARRKDIAKQAANLTPPLYSDPDSISEYTKKIKDLNKEGQDANHLIDYDLDRYKHAYLLACEEISVYGPLSPHEYMNDFFKQANEAVPLAAKDREALEASRERERQAELDAEKRKAKAEDDELKSRGDVKGQMKLFKDDGSVAEEASECVTRPLDEANESEEAEAAWQEDATEEAEADY